MGQTFEIVVVDGSIAAYSEFTPVSGADIVKYSTSDRLAFSNGVSLERALWTYTVGVTFTWDQDGSTSTTTVAHAGAPPGGTVLTNLPFAAETSTAAFLPLKVETTADLTGETGWTKHPDCGTVNYQGSFVIAYYSNGGVAQTPLTLYYQVCDTQQEIYVDNVKTLTSADWAYISTRATLATDPETSHEVVIQGTEYVFASAASATTVTLRPGHVVPITSTTHDSYLLLRFPDAFPAGLFETTLTATASDITI